jgi:hypothetical protein
MDAAEFHEVFGVFELAKCWVKVGSFMSTGYAKYFFFFSFYL